MIELETKLRKVFREASARALWNALEAPGKDIARGNLERLRKEFLDNCHVSRDLFARFENPEALCIDWEEGMMVLPAIIVYLLPDNFELDYRSKHVRCSGVKRGSLVFDGEFFAEGENYGVKPFEREEREAEALCYKILSNPEMKDYGDDEDAIDVRLGHDRLRPCFHIKSDTLGEVTINDDGSMFLGDDSCWVSVERQRVLTDLCEQIRQIFKGKTWW